VVMRVTNGCLHGTVRLPGRWRIGWAVALDFFWLFLTTQVALYNVVWFRGEGVSVFRLPFGEYRMTLDGEVATWRASKAE